MATLSLATTSTARRSMPCSGFLGHYVPVHHQDIAPRNCGGAYAKSSAAPQVDGDDEWVRRHRLHQEHGGCRAAPVACLSYHCQHKVVPRLNQQWCGTQPRQSYDLQEAADTDGESPAITSILRSGSSVGYAARLYHPLHHIRDA
jgi:hypothetical protein